MIRWTPERNGDGFFRRGLEDQLNDKNKGKDRRKRLPACTGTAGCVWEGAQVKASIVTRKEKQENSKPYKSSRSEMTPDFKSKTNSLVTLFGKDEEWNEGLTSSSKPTLMRSDKHYKSERHPDTVFEAAESTPLKSPTMSRRVRKALSSFNPPLQHDTISHSTRFQRPVEVNIDSSHPASAPVSPLLHTPRNGQDTPVIMTMQGEILPHEKQEGKSRGNKFKEGIQKTTNYALKTLPSQMNQTAKYPQRSITPGRRRPSHPRRTS